jgi:DNA-binding transcriptional LysR family regulator
MFTLAQLEAFVAAADHQHFTRAAAALHLTQPAVTAHVRNLERSLRVPLFEVRGRRVYLTEAGALLREHAAAVLQAVAATEAALRDYAALETGQVVLGATRTIGSYALPDLLARFRGEVPGIELRISIDNTAAIARQLRDRAIDLALVEGDIASPDFVVRPFRHDELVVLTPPSDPLAHAVVVDLEDLRGRPFVRRELGSGTRAIAERLLGDLFTEAPTALVLDSPEAINRAVAAGLGLGVQSILIAERDVALGRLSAVRVRDHPMQRWFSLVYLKGRILGPGARRFIEVLGLSVM